MFRVRVSTFGPHAGRRGCLEPDAATVSGLQAHKSQSPASPLRPQSPLHQPASGAWRTSHTWKSFPSLSASAPHGTPPGVALGALPASPGLSAS
eukprot:685665-Amphidinium_carterae.1